MAVVHGAGAARGGPALHTIGESAAVQRVAQPQQASSYDDLPLVAHANEQKALKSEDVIYVRRVEPSYGNAHSIFMVCDGHAGDGAANHCVEHMPVLLGQLLPPHLPNWADMSEVIDYAEKVRRAISTAAVLLDNDWTRTCEISGTTMTLAVVSGWLLTMANTGDSNAIVDTGDDVQEITLSHRIQVNKAEQNRLRQHGAQLAPLGFHLQGPARPQEMGVGPLRMWPGGLCVSRSIGDLDSGPLIVPLPHVRQVLLTRHRALRLIMASDGLWDLMTFSKTAKSVRHKLPHQAVNTLVQMVARDKRMADDVSVILVDLLPPPARGVQPQQFPASALQAGAKGGAAGGAGGGSAPAARPGRVSSGGLFGCFKAPAVAHEPEPAAAEPPRAAAAAVAVAGPAPLDRPWAGLTYLADVDCYQAYPVHGKELARVSVPAAQRPPPPKRAGDYTVHGGQAHKFQPDTSWHTGDSMHGAGRMPRMLSQAQLEQLQAAGPAAAAGMVLTGPNDAAGLCAAPPGADDESPFASAEQAPLRRQLSGAGGPDAAGGVLDRDAALRMMGSAAAGQPPPQQQQQLAGGRDAGGGAAAPAMSSRLSHLLPNDAYDSASGAALQGAARSLPAGGGGGGGGAAGPASPAPGALLRSASAEFEPDDTAVYVAGDDAPDGKASSRTLAAPGRVVGVNTASKAVRFGSAPAVSHSEGGRVVHSSSPLSAAAVAADEEEELRMRGVRCALSSDGGDGTHHAGGSGI